MPSDEGEFGLIALDDGKAAFPVGHVRLLNLSGLAVRGALDDASFELPVLPRITAPQRIGSRVKVGVAFERQSDRWSASTNRYR